MTDCNSDSDSDSPHKSSESFSLILPNILRRTLPVVDQSDISISQVGSGTYSYVFGLSDAKVIKVYHAEESYRDKYIKSPKYFEAGSFRETFFNSILNHKNLFKYDSVHHDPELGLYKIGRRMQGPINSPKLTRLFNENMFFRLLGDITEGLLHLHSYGIIHSDVKPSNILYDIDEKNNIYFKLCDFNISQFCSVSNPDVYDIFASLNYCDKKEKRSIVTDV